jgi:hypothetical protein
MTKKASLGNDNLSTASGMIFGRSPLYAVLFSTEADLTQPYFPLVAAPQSGELGALPHGLARDMAEALPGLWYCLHLPNIFQELIDIPATNLKARQALHLDHQILLVPIQAFNKEALPRWQPWMAPTLVVCPDDLLEEATRKASLMGFPLSATCYSQISNDTLRDHWRAIHAHFVSGTPYPGREPTLTHRLDLAPTDLPNRWLMRQMTDDPSAVAPSNEAPTQLIERVLDNQLLLAAISRLEYDGATIEEAAKKFPDTMENERARLRFPVVLALPGVAPAYIRNIYDQSARRGLKSLSAVDKDDTWSVTMAERADHLVERAAIEFVTTHQAIARSGVGLMLGAIPREAFIVLAQLEKHFVEGPNGPTVHRLLDRLQKNVASLWTDATTLSISRASMITVFSNFPIGLLRFPRDTTSLTNRVPIAYRPLLPLTRTMQQELIYIPPIDLASKFHILVAECIPESDIVGRYSRSGWQFVADMIRDENCGITIQLEETLSIDALRGAISGSRPEILVISAHGYLDTQRNLAGLMVGDDFYLGPGIDSLPPVVILSACHVAPRGAGTVSLTDLLLREGAVAVLGTQVPVDVRRNAMLMMRFFVNMAEVLAGRERERFSNLLDVWHHVQMTNAINDILSGAPSIHDWGMANGPSGLPVITEFMQLRSAGRLRWGHIYHDTETVLAEIADDQGVGERVRNWFKSPGYIPESLFYEGYSQSRVIRQKARKSSARLSERRPASRKDWVTALNLRKRAVACIIPRVSPGMRSSSSAP